MKKISTLVLGLLLTSAAFAHGGGHGGGWGGGHGGHGGGGHWGGGHGGPGAHAVFTCIAKNRLGRSFSDTSRDRSDAERGALRDCRRNSFPFVAPTCYIARCNRS